MSTTEAVSERTEARYAGQTSGVSPAAQVPALPLIGVFILMCVAMIHTLGSGPASLITLRGEDG